MGRRATAPAGSRPTVEAHVRVRLRQRVVARRRQSRRPTHRASRRRLGGRRHRPRRRRRHRLPGRPSGRDSDVDAGTSGRRGRRRSDSVSPRRRHERQRPRRRDASAATTSAAGWGAAPGVVVAEPVTPRRVPRQRLRVGRGHVAACADSHQQPTRDQPAGGRRRAVRVPAGWYPDPSGRYELRYWDGSDVDRARVRSRCSSTPTRPSPDTAGDAPACSTTHSAGPMRATSIGHAGILDRDRRTARSCAIRGSCRRSSARGSCSPATTSSPPELLERDRAARLPLRLAPPRRPPRRGVPRRPRRPVDHRAAARLPHRRARATAARASASPSSCARRRRGARPRRRSSVAIHVETSITDGPGGDSALVVDDGDVPARRTRTTAGSTTPTPSPPRPGRPALAAVLRRDLVPDGVRARRRRTMRELVDAKVEASSARAMRYVEAVGARAVVPCAGPPCFLDPELFQLNVITGDEPSIFPDQRVFLERLVDGRHHAGLLAIPGTDDRRRPRGDHRHPPGARRRRGGDLRATRATYLARYQADWIALARRRAGRRGRRRAQRPARRRCRRGGSRCWPWRPTAARGRRRRLLLRRRRRRRRRDPRSTSPPARCAPTPASPTGSASTSHRPLVETVVAERRRRLEQLAVPVVPLPGLAGRASSTSTSTTSSSRSRRSACAAPRPRRCRKLHPPTETEPDIELGDCVVQRRCPHRNADLAVFGEVDGCELTCTLHGWRFDLETGRVPHRRPNHSIAEPGSRRDARGSGLT